MNKEITLGTWSGQENAKSTLEDIQSNLVDFVLNSAGLTIGSGSKKKPLIANTIYYMIDGVMYKKTTAEITLTTANTVAADLFNVIVLTIDSAGTVTPTNGTAGATLEAVVFPAVPANQAVIGFVIVNPTGTGNFVGGSTDFDDGTVVPNAVYIDTPYPFNLNSLTLPWA